MYKYSIAIEITTEELVYCLQEWYIIKCRWYSAHLCKVSMKNESYKHVFRAF